MLRLLACIALLCPAILRAQEFVETEGLLSDEAFYRLVACAAPPDGTCAKKFLRWPSGDQIRVSLEPLDRAFLGGKQKRAKAALTRAIQYLNRVPMNLSLTQVPPENDADIRIYFVDTDGSEPISGTGLPGVDGQTVAGARVIVWARNGVINRSVIIFGTRLHIRSYESAMLEELTQALGLLTDIRNPDYDDISIFSQDSNASKTLGPQDIKALQRHYPQD
ncbi:hypothetical protein TRP8649_01706 [Pelagimonas phthalicica]|uniref:DUF2927 domain-containing protein n=1 Tax=Pelagimonas phthalicica TaxID=1037362 RepID=A0A238JA62_9RHOB|nr:DUF2927 domain-containing protein [Pelagimonas phthalicica]TDS93876.1 Protein of unknown function (DUF2927) [Pelagimonas phthalicica]SMX27600.1 hypothetical protein TRP8649_01706 [Pelagimonas phthalicica]